MNQKGKEEDNVEACVYPLKLLDSATCDDVAVPKKNDLPRITIYIYVRCSNKINIRTYVCV